MEREGESQNRHQSQGYSDSHAEMGKGQEPGYLTYGFKRIIACGLPGKETTWLAKERVFHAPTGELSHDASDELSIEQAADVLAGELVRLLNESVAKSGGREGLSGIEKISEDDVLSSEIFIGHYSRQDEVISLARSVALSQTPSLFTTPFSSPSPGAVILCSFPIAEFLRKSCTPQHRQRKPARGLSMLQKGSEM
jgi:hypothetical protein